MTKMKLADHDQALADLTEGFRMQWSKAQGLARRSVEVAWHAGKTLAAVKAHLAHGQWLPWLEAEGIARRTANRLLLLATFEMGQLGPFQSVDEALKSLPKPAPKPASTSTPFPVADDLKAAMGRCMANWRAAVENATEGTPEHDGIVQSVPDGLVSGLVWADKGDAAIIMRAYDVEG